MNELLIFIPLVLIAILCVSIKMKDKEVDGITCFFVLLVLSIVFLFPMVLFFHGGIQTDSFIKVILRIIGFYVVLFLWDILKVMYSNRQGDCSDSSAGMMMYISIIGFILLIGSYGILKLFQNINP